jgi:hypothetical protein
LDLLLWRRPPTQQETAEKSFRILAPSWKNNDTIASYGSKIIARVMAEAQLLRSACSTPPPAVSFFSSLIDQHYQWRWHLVRATRIDAILHPAGSGGPPPLFDVFDDAIRVGVRGSVNSTPPAGWTNPLAFSKGWFLARLWTSWWPTPSFEPPTRDLMVAWIGVPELVLHVGWQASVHGTGRREWHERFFPCGPPKWCGPSCYTFTSTPARTAIITITDWSILRMSGGGGGGGGASLENWCGINAIRLNGENLWLQGAACKGAVVVEIMPPRR